MNRFTDQLLMRDIKLLQFIHIKTRCKTLNRLMSYITHLGGTVFVISISLLFIVLGQEKSRIGWELLLVLATSHLLVQIIKRKINRPRP